MHITFLSEDLGLSQRTYLENTCTPILKDTFFLLYHNVVDFGQEFFIAYALALYKDSAILKEKFC